jgi:hypothetical protein
MTKHHTRYLIAAFCLAGCARTPPVAGSAVVTAPQDSVTTERLRLAREVLASIAGRETEPAGQVFKNVKRLTAVPARNLIAIMNIGYGKSLGVSCSHCHVVGTWDSDEKPQKQIARDMAAMSQAINTQLLPGIKNLKGPNPVVNCTTCHRGSVKPALDLP